MSLDELKSCPICKYRLRLYEDHTEEDTQVWVCPNCWKLSTYLKEFHT